MKQRWTEEELVEFWTLTHAEQQLLSQRTERGRLSYAVLIKFFQLEGRFPAYNKEVPAIAVEFLAEQLHVSASLWLDISLDNRSSERARAEIRAFLGFRVATVERHRGGQPSNPIVAHP